MIQVRNLIVLTLILGLSFSMAACKVEVEENDGPFERVGEDLDKGVKELGKGIEKAGEEIQDSADKAKHNL